MAIEKMAGNEGRNERQPRLKAAKEPKRLPAAKTFPALPPAAPTLMEKPIGKATKQARFMEGRGFGIPTPKGAFAITRAPDGVELLGFASAIGLGQATLGGSTPMSERLYALATDPSTRDATLAVLTAMDGDPRLSFEARNGFTKLKGAFETMIKRRLGKAAFEESAREAGMIAMAIAEPVPKLDYTSSKEYPREDRDKALVQRYVDNAFAAQ